MLVCKMEKVFPPGWFNVIQHLLVHLPWEGKVGGPMQFRWMYSQERELKKLRSTVWLEVSRLLAATSNSRVVTSVEDASRVSADYYGILQKIIEYTFRGA
jgi:hypothetical protein